MRLLIKVVNFLPLCNIQPMRSRRCMLCVLKFCVVAMQYLPCYSDWKLSDGASYTHTHSHSHAHICSCTHANFVCFVYIYVCVCARVCMQFVCILALLFLYVYVTSLQQKISLPTLTFVYMQLHIRSSLKFCYDK